MTDEFTPTPDAQHDDRTARRLGGPHADRDPFPAIAEEVERHLGDDASGHNVAHTWRVFQVGMDLAEQVGADTDVVGAAALVHDLHRAMGDGTGVNPVETLDEVAAILDRAGFPETKVGDVQHAVAVHDTYRYRDDDRMPETLEAEVLRDADNLDAMGAVGVARTFAFGGVHGNPLWDPEGDEHSGISHFEDKLLRLREEMHTDPARELAEERHAFLERFRARFEAEWFGDA